MEEFKRFRRIRENKWIRDLVGETIVSKDKFIMPYFVIPGSNKKETIETMPDVFRFSVDMLLKDVEEKIKIGIHKIILFGVNEEKTENGQSAFSNDNVVFKAIEQLKKEFKEEIYVISDVCLCAYTHSGHCGIVDNGHILNDETLASLGKMAVSHAQAGVDMVAPSDMMDGRIQFLRNQLDANGFYALPILSYASKFASAYYGPFREAAQSAPTFGDRKTYQLDFRNGKQAVAEALADENEGADILMVKPALAYLDIIHQLKQKTNKPICCYNISGEYAMIKWASQKGILNEENVVVENMFAFVRAGADMIISYHTKDIFTKNWL